MPAAPTVYGTLSSLSDSLSASVSASPRRAMLLPLCVAPTAERRAQGTYLYLNSQRLSAGVLAALNATCGASSPSCALPSVGGSPWASTYVGGAAPALLRCPQAPGTRARAPCCSAAHPACREPDQHGRGRRASAIGPARERLTARPAAHRLPGRRQRQPGLQRDLRLGQVRPGRRERLPGARRRGQRRGHLPDQARPAAQAAVACSPLPRLFSLAALITGAPCGGRAEVQAPRGRHISILLGQEDTAPNFRLDQSCAADAQARAPGCRLLPRGAAFVPALCCPLRAFPA